MSARLSLPARAAAHVANARAWLALARLALSIDQPGKAREYIMRARLAWAYWRALAPRVQLTAHYLRHDGSWWRAETCVGGRRGAGWVWRSSRLYGKRQSAQRAAHAHLRHLPAGILLG